MISNLDSSLSRGMMGTISWSFDNNASSQCLCILPLASSACNSVISWLLYVDVLCLEQEYIELTLGDGTQEYPCWRLSINSELLVVVGTISDHRVESNSTIVFKYNLLEHFVADLIYCCGVNILN